MSGGLDSIIFEGCENIYDHAYDENDNYHSIQTKIIAVRNYRSPSSTDAGPSVPRDWLSMPEWAQTLFVSYPDTYFLDIVLVDGGVGIYTRLAQPFHDWITEYLQNTQRRLPTAAEIAELSCLEWALSKIRSSHLKDKRRGYGLYSLRRYVADGWGGALLLRSGNSRVVYLPDGKTDKRQDLISMNGTQLRILLPITDRAEQIAAVAADLRILIEGSNVITGH
jgi:hypothetical protein